MLGKNESIKHILVDYRKYVFYALKEGKINMNKCFIKALTLEEPKFDFLYMSNSTSIAYFYIQLSNGSIIKTFGYDEIADYIYRTIKKEDTIIINGEMRNENNILEIEIKEIKKCKNIKEIDEF